MLNISKSVANIFENKNPPLPPLSSEPGMERTFSTVTSPSLNPVFGTLNNKVFFFVSLLFIL